VEQARRHYGVVLDEATSALDEVATERLRADLRSQRLGSDCEKRRTLDVSAGPIALRLDFALGTAACGACGHELGPLRANWKSAAREHVQPLAELGETFSSTRFVLRTYACP